MPRESVMSLSLHAMYSHCFRYLPPLCITTYSWQFSPIAGTLGIELRDLTKMKTVPLVRQDWINEGRVSLYLCLPTKGVSFCMILTRPKFVFIYLFGSVWLHFLHIFFVAFLVPRLAKGSIFFLLIPPSVRWERIFCRCMRFIAITSGQPFICLYRRHLIILIPVSWPFHIFCNP